MKVKIYMNLNDLGASGGAYTIRANVFTISQNLSDTYTFVMTVPTTMITEGMKMTGRFVFGNQYIDVPMEKSGDTTFDCVVPYFNTTERLVEFGIYTDTGIVSRSVPFPLLTTILSSDAKPAEDISFHL